HRPPRPPLFPYTTLFRSVGEDRTGPYPAGDPVSGGGLVKSNPQWFFQQMWGNAELRLRVADHVQKHFFNGGALTPEQSVARFMRSEEHTSELQSLRHLVC